MPMDHGFARRDVPGAGFVAAEEFPKVSTLARPARARPRVKM